MQHQPAPGQHHSAARTLREKVCALCRLPLSQCKCMG